MTSLEAARRLLPTWLSWVAGLPLLPIGFGIGLGTTGLACWVARARIRRSPEEHWTVTAASQYPARQVATISLGMCVAFAVSALVQLLGPLCRIPVVPMGFFIGVATFLGCALPAARVAPAPAFRKGTLRYVRGLLTQSRRELDRIRIRGRRRRLRRVRNYGALTGGSRGWFRLDADS